jgi:LmbE family N-acetylglucosaminyl deacetylase
MITFGPEGAVTAHPDHSMASLFATLAYEWAGRTNRYQDQFKDGLRPHRTHKLYYGTANFTLPDREPVSLPPVTATIEIGPFLETKLAAFHAHTSQTPLFPILENTVRHNGTKELYHLAARIEPGPVEFETDLFAGVSED